MSYCYIGAIKLSQTAGEMSNMYFLSKSSSFFSLVLLSHQIYAAWESHDLGPGL